MHFCAETARTARLGGINPNYAKFNRYIIETKSARMYNYSDSPSYQNTLVIFDFPLLSVIILIKVPNPILSWIYSIIKIPGLLIGASLKYPSFTQILLS